MEGQVVEYPTSTSANSCPVFLYDMCYLLISFLGTWAAGIRRHVKNGRFIFFLRKSIISWAWQRATENANLKANNTRTSMPKERCQFYPSFSNYMPPPLLMANVLKIHFFLWEPFFFTTWGPWTTHGTIQLHNLSQFYLWQSSSSFMATYIQIV